MCLSIGFGYNGFDDPNNWNIDFGLIKLWTDKWQLTVSVKQNISTVHKRKKYTFLIYG